MEKCSERPKCQKTIKKQLSKLMIVAEVMQFGCKTPKEDMYG